MAGAPVLLHHLRWLAPYLSWALLRLPKPWRDPLVGEVAHGVLAAWHDHDVDTLLVVYDEDAVIQMSKWSDWLGRSFYQGADGVREFVADFLRRLEGLQPSADSPARTQP